MLGRFFALAVVASLSSVALGETPGYPSGSDLAARLLEAQNAERRALGLPAMEWDAGLEQAAGQYAGVLARTGQWQHSEPAFRRGQGENLWMGTRGAFSAEQMIDGWLSERRNYRAGLFPNVSATGNWEDVGHYTQVIWSDTDRVGCAVRSSAQFDYLVCRYAQPGNVMGQSVTAGRIAALR
jgi:hypothetical protein